MVFQFELKDKVESFTQMSIVDLVSGESGEAYRSRTKGKAPTLELPLEAQCAHRRSKASIFAEKML